MKVRQIKGDPLWWDLIATIEVWSCLKTLATYVFHSLTLSSIYCSLYIHFFRVGLFLISYTLLAKK